MNQAPALPRIGIISAAPGGGWNTVRKRWEEHFSRCEEAEFRFYRAEDYAPRIYRRTVAKHRLRSLWYLTAGRAAARRAIRDGCSTILINTYHYAVWMPLRKNVRYFIYGDATARQLTALRPLAANRGGKLPFIIDQLYRLGTKRLARHGAVFLGMSRWYLNDLRDGFGVPESQLTELPFGLDLNRWQRRETAENTASGAGLDILFVGDPFDIKGGPILQEVAAMPEFSRCTFHFVGRTFNFRDAGNCRYYRNLQADSDDLLDLFSRCDLMALPTYSDFSPNVAIEAMAMGLPVIITDVAAISEIVTDGETGRLIPHPPDPETVRAKLLEYLKDSALLKKESAAARRRAEAHFDLNTHMTHLYDYLVSFPRK
ncbi:MAG: glycosyltransferase family 4 protein [Victivallaceae bacterium]|nr:glycosyltransferase family 4 protein [Victivallaceae bacterium]